MAYLSSPWSAGHHLGALSTLASKLERLERQAELLDNLQEEEEESQVCAVDISKHSGTLSPAAEDPGRRRAGVCRGAVLGCVAGHDFHTTAALVQAINPPPSMVLTMS